ncbi:MAG TPA: hypothetical protein VJY62_00120 [Bacteroidia bacterium]|nr:hypothetical protein [Bacteroidia bacterium]
MEQIAKIKISERKDKIIKILNDWKEHGDALAIIRSISINSYKLKNDELEIIAEQKQNLRIYLQNNNWLPEIKSGPAKYHTIAIADPLCSFEMEQSMLRKFLESLDLLLIFEREKTINQLKK